ncbi:endoribonuclease ZC3H12A [Periophthalmus magnuspinnatus]|uniref:endoribonuclease ZC3H12A n=1 Tax=Periophthalmus magnuspinnatus TaxID=409849 RepID=UPI002436A6B1|nr:endoribonuclease ZC3H12A [Periophthalmus magnuspinnatus]
MNSEVLFARNIWTEMFQDRSLTWPSSPPPSSTSSTSLSLPDSLHQQAHSRSQLELFHKLGYTTEQVQKVVLKFGPGMDTDKLLEKLVKIDETKHSDPQTVRMNVPIVQGGTCTTRAPTQMPVLGSGLSQGPEESGEEEDPYRHVVIDGSNIAMSHGNKEVFSCLGIQIAVNFFLERGHKSVTVFVPSWRNEKPRPDVPISDQHILRELEKRKLLVFTPSKRVNGKRIVCHDDRYIVKLAYDEDGLIVSNDMYRDLQRENPEWKRFIEERLIMFSFVNNKFMPPDDPMGRHGPSLDDLRRKCPVVQKKQPCPYGKKCTFGIKCRFLHPERPKQSNQSLADELRSRSSAPALTPAPGHSLSLVEDMAKKLTLGGTMKKEHHPELSTISPGVKGHSKKSCSKKDRKSRQTSLEQGSVTSIDSHDLDSGLGSIDPHYDATYGTNLYSQPHSAPCHCCHVTAPHHSFQQHPHITQSEINFAYNMTAHPNYGSYSGGMRAYSQHRPPQQMYWSDPYMAAPRAMCRAPEESSQWEQSQVSAGHAKDQREAVRKKLLAIFNVQLVDTAMNLNPQLLDPQRLLAEILRLQGQGL